MEAVWQGPYPVQRKVDKVNYKIDMGPHRTKRYRVFHINLLRRFRRSHLAAFTVPMAEDDPDTELLLDDCSHLHVNGGRPTINPDLSPDQRQQLAMLLSEFEDTLLPQPGQMAMVAHSIHTGDATPIRSRPYRLVAAHHSVVRNAVDEMLDMCVLRPSRSPWSSSLFPIKAGVPQGSLLDPTLFLLYVNDAEQCLAPGSSLAVYADDTTLYALIRNPDTIAAAFNSLQASIDCLQTWGAQWKKKFEPSKSQAILLDRHRPSLDVPQLTFDGMQVPESPQLKLLGVLFDSTLSFRAHIRSLVVRANQRLGLVRKASRILDSAGRLTVYKEFVWPIME